MKTLLVPIDFSDITTEVIETARELCTALGARLVIINVAEAEPDFVGFEAGPPSVRAAVARDFKAEHQRLDDIKAKLAAKGCEAAVFHLQGPTVDKILLEAAQQNASLIVIGSHGHGAIYDLLVGSVTHGVIKEAPCPVVVVPAPKRK